MLQNLSKYMKLFLRIVELVGRSRGDTVDSRDPLDLSLHAGEQNASYFSPSLNVSSYSYPCGRNGNEIIGKFVQFPPSYEKTRVRRAFKIFFYLWLMRWNLLKEILKWMKISKGEILICSVDPHQLQTLHGRDWARFLLSPYIFCYLIFPTYTF